MFRDKKIKDVITVNMRALLKYFLKDKFFFDKIKQIGIKNNKAIK